MKNASSATQNLVVVGPNLPATLSRKGTFHVHTSDCADLKRGPIRPYAEEDLQYAQDFSTLVEVAEYVYDNGIMAEDETGADYLFDFHFAPCVTLPVDAETPATCAYSARHAADGVPATTTIDCGPVGIVRACQPCADFYAKA